MNMNSNKVQEIIETVIGEDNSKYVFGENYKRLYQIISDLELTKESIINLLYKCKFKDPEKIGFITLFCPLVCLDIVDRVIKRGFREIYKITVCFWYFCAIIYVINACMDRSIDPVFYLMIINAVIISICFRFWSRNYNCLELLIHCEQELDKMIEEENQKS